MKQVKCHAGVLNAEVQLNCIDLHTYDQPHPKHHMM